MTIGLFHHSLLASRHLRNLVRPPQLLDQLILYQNAQASATLTIGGGLMCMQACLLLLQDLFVVTMRMVSNAIATFRR